MRTGFGSNNVDHCTRLCHASSVAALLEGIGSGAVSNPVMDVTKAEVVIIIGANPTVNHPVAATWIKNAVKNGTKLIVMDPRRSDLTRLAHRYLQFKPDTDVAMLNAMMHVIVTEGLVDEEFIASRTIGYEDLRKNVEGYTPEAMAPICGIDADTLRYVARLYATSKGSMILWGMGISQHVHGTDNARCLIALALMTGQIGRPGTGLHPLRGQNNVQGASDAGLIPMAFPDYQRVADPKARARFEKAWGVAAGSLDDQVGPDGGRGDACDQGGRASAACTCRARTRPCPTRTPTMRAKSLAALDHLVVQDIFLTETAYLADVILPASAFPEKTGTFTNTDRLVQMGRKARQPAGRCAAGPVDHPGDRQAARARLAVRPRQRGVRRDAPHHAQHRRHHLGAARARACRHLPLPEGRRSRRVRGVRRGLPARERTRPLRSGRHHPGRRAARTAEYPMVLITGRQLEHWHTGSMTRRATVLDAIEPDPVALIHPLDLADMGSQPGDVVTIESRRGSVSLYARADESSPRGAVFVPFCYYEAAINKLTNAALDPFAKIPEFKYCAIRVVPGGAEPQQSSFGGGQALANATA